MFFFYVVAVADRALGGHGGTLHGRLGLFVSRDEEDLAEDEEV